MLARESPVRGDVLVRSLDWLGRCAALVVGCPTLTLCDSQHAAASIDGILAHLSRVSDYDFALHCPTKAVLGQAYLVAKINFIRAMMSALVAVGGAPELMARLRAELGQSIYS